MKNPLGSGSGQVAKHTYRLHMAYSVTEGIIAGVLALNEFVFVKSLDGSDFTLGLLFQFSAFVLTFSVLINEWTRRARDRVKLILVTGLLTRAPLFLLALFPAHISTLTGNGWWHACFLGIFLVYWMANPILFPVINLLLKTNYSHAKFGILYSYATTANKIVMVLVTFLYGVLLDSDADAYRYVFPFVGVLGMTSVWLLSRIRQTEQSSAAEFRSFFMTIRSTLSELKRKMRDNKPFRDFETGFMFYGFAFMGTVSVITLFYDDALGLNYSSVAFYKNSYNLLAIILLPFMGRLLGKIDPRRFAAITFSSLLFYLLFIALTMYFRWSITIMGVTIYFTLFLAMMFNGVFAATMSLLWSIGSAYFCKREEASYYQSIHLSFTGLRSFFAPVLGVWVYQLIGYTGTFVMGMVLLAIGIIVSLRSQVRHSMAD